MTIDLNSMTQGERRALLSELFKESIGAVPVNLPPYDLAVPLVSEVVQPGRQATISAYPQIKCALKRMIVFPTTAQRMDTVVREHWGDVTRGRLWWKRTEHVLLERHSVPKFVEQHVPRAAWIIRQMFVGNMIVFPSYGLMSGDLFAPDSDLGINMDCEPALAVSVVVENRSTVAASFSGVVLAVDKARLLKAV